MWNFICQKHRGVFTNCVFQWATQPTSTPTFIDATRATSNEVFYWTEHSFNYLVDLGPVDVYQLHVYGGDTEHGRASGMQFLKDNLRSGGPLRPVIVVQHYDFGSFSIPAWWTETQRDALLNVLEPYNVIAFLMGHEHNRLHQVPSRQSYPAPSTKKSIGFGQVRQESMATLRYCALPATRLITCRVPEQAAR